MSGGSEVRYFQKLLIERYRSVDFDQIVNRQGGGRFTLPRRLDANMVNGYALWCCKYGE